MTEKVQNKIIELGLTAETPTLYDLDVSAEDRFNILTILGLFTSRGSFKGGENVKEWLSFPDHRRPENTGYHEYGYFSGCFYRFKADFEKNHPDLFKILYPKYKQEEITGLYIAEKLRSKVKELRDSKKNDEAAELFEILMNDDYKKMYKYYYEHYPDSPFAKRIDALNKAYAIMHNEYGLTDSIIMKTAYSF